jgi:hypothetical protein
MTGQDKGGPCPAADPLSTVADGVHYRRRPDWSVHGYRLARCVHGLADWGLRWAAEAAWPLPSVSGPSPNVTRLN